MLCTECGPLRKLEWVGVVGDVSGRDGWIGRMLGRRL